MPWLPFSLGLRSTKEMLASLTKTLANKRFVLASSSPRRKEIMETIGIRCDVVSPAVDENISFSEHSSVPDYVETLASLKADAAADILGHRHVCL
ncbi:hypothetical protein FGIG_09306 [Fasciola gigantica]|uniref:N-acetylserotonin O-methyltransferase protein n=1 Tax=Fasciola gigantica TaxID=46835 RepID=A0A504Z2X5_FASGI|nr:hypothetical protein FGIG_09306 [Fasciola gigantica]